MLVKLRTSTEQFNPQSLHRLQIRLVDVWAWELMATRDWLNQKGRYVSMYESSFPFTFQVRPCPLKTSLWSRWTIWQNCEVRSMLGVWVHRRRKRGRGGEWTPTRTPLTRRYSWKSRPVIGGFLLLWNTSRNQTLNQNLFTWINLRKSQTERLLNPLILWAQVVVLRNKVIIL